MNSNHPQADTPETVDDGVVVTIEYRLTVDGEMVDTTEGEGPLEYLHGYGNIVPGLEDALYDLKVGDERDVIVAPADGYGDYEKDAVSEVPRSEFPDEIPLEVGTEIEMEDEDGELIEATITKVSPKTVTLDFNHPLAGKTLNFWVKVTGLRAATAEELDHGHVHYEGFEEGDDYDEDEE